ncbi:DUF1636 domain-containing protein [Azospirillum halopraeferens]|uniref:DUF1636 domain-containing protein n=1 Tax=Azospirillum halopraeferens TaxID=34010 RepID=UPI000400F288|nr:DUF1636 domain-containing protein [Azospirillum halopraeferens]
MTEVIVCETCRHPDVPPTEDGPTAGAVLAGALRTALAGRAGTADVRLSTMRCLMSCKRSCAVHVRAPGKMAYVLGDLAPTADTAHTLAAYVEAYAAADDGVVPFRQWPEGVKGRFVARVPPLPAPAGPAGTEGEGG